MYTTCPSDRRLALSVFSWGVLFGLLVGSSAMAEDWPMWRYDAGRSAASPHDLPESLVLQWTKKYAPRVQVWDDPLNHDLMQYDRLFEPIIMGQRVYVGFNDSDKVVCWNLMTGEEEWRFYTQGPVRFPPVGCNQRLYVVSDDGYLYCLHADSGRLAWKIRGGPSDRQVLGNRRLISLWPARGGPVVIDGTVHFAAGIWPWMGTFIYALNAESGEVRWVNEDSSHQYILQPHSAASFAGVAPQGALAATEEYLIVPGGRSVPAVFDRQQGKLVHFLLNEGGKGTGGAAVMARHRDLYVHTRGRGVRKMDLVSGKKTEVMFNEPVLGDGIVYTSDATGVRAVNDGKEVVWEVAVDGKLDLIQAGRRLYAAGESAISVLELGPTADVAPRVVGTLPLAGAARLVAGGGTLVAVTADGGIHAFGVATGTDPTDPSDLTDLTDLTDPSIPTYPSDASLGSLLAEHEAADGYAIVYVTNKDATRDHFALLDKLLSSTRLHLIVVAADADQLRQLQDRYDARGEYGHRLVAHFGNPSTFQPPPYFAHAVIIGDAQTAREITTDTLRTVFQAVRPYGGILWYPLSDGSDSLARRWDEAELSRAEIVRHPAHGVLAKRSGPLAGSAPWTHLYGNVANTVKSDDQLVRAPLGILWFGGNTHDDILPRHSHSPPEQVVGGRLFVEGMNSLSARDVYTGRLLWRREFQDLGTAGIYYDETYQYTPLDPAYNQVHIPGANSRGSNYVATEHEIYLVIGADCHVLDTRDGHTLRVLTLPPADREGDLPRWTYLGVYQDVLLAGVDFASYAQRTGFQFSPEKRRGDAWNPEWFGSRGLMALDRQTGKLLWRVEARHSFLHNGIVAGDGTVYLLDKLPQSVEDQRSRRGQDLPRDYRLLAFEVRSGAPRWERAEQVFGTWLGYSEDLDVLIQSGAAGADRLPDEVDKGVLALRGSDGAKLWQKPELVLAGPPILHRDRLITNSQRSQSTSGVFRLLDGVEVLIKNPLTGKDQSWTYQRQHGCNTAVACEHLLTFRSGAASFYDLNQQSGVSNLGGFRSGCTSNLIAADGVLNAPDFTRTCSCGYQNQTSLALVHMPELEAWSLNPFRVDSALWRLGINFGAPGTHKTPDGTLWVEYPPADREQSFPIEIELQGVNQEFYRRHASAAQGEYSSVIASGVKGVERMILTLPDHPDTDQATYTVRCYFGANEPRSARPIGLTVQGSVVEASNDLSSGSRIGAGDLVRHEIQRVKPVERRITITLRSTEAELPAELAGVELIRDDVR